MRRLCAVYARDPQDREDLFQNIFLALWKAVDRQLVVMWLEGFTAAEMAEAAADPAGRWNRNSGADYARR